MTAATGILAAVAVLAAAGAGRAPASAPAPDDAPIVTGFHHVHLNVVDPARSVAFYQTHFNSKPVTVAGWDAVQAEDIYLLFTKVAMPASYEWDTAIWHFGWITRTLAEDFKRMSEAGVKFFRVPPPTAHLIGPAGEDVEIAPAHGTFFHPPPAFNHVHLQAENPYCAGDWYERMLGLLVVPDGKRVADTDCRVPYTPRQQPANLHMSPYSAVRVGRIELSLYPQQRLKAYTQQEIEQGPLVSSRGHAIDHIALTVADFPAAVRKLRAAGVTVLENAHAFGTSSERAVMIEGPDKIAIELIEQKKP